MNEKGRIVLKSIYQNHWLKVEYENQNNEITKYMIGVNDINYYNKKLSIDCFNIMYSSEVDQRVIYYDKIRSIEICEDTYHKTPKKLIEKLEDNTENYAFLQDDFSKINLLEYYLDCYKLDVVPYISTYTLVPGLDNQVITDNKGFPLSNEQFKELAIKVFNQSKEKKKNKENGYFIDIQLGMNVISILEPSKGLYVLAYRPLKLDVKNKSLVPIGNIIVNKEFSYDKNTGNIRNKESIAKFLPEEDFNLLENVDENKEKILESLRTYNNTKNVSYAKEVKIDAEPYIISLAKNMVIDLNVEFVGIKKMIEYPETMTIPIQTFFGDSNVKKTRTKLPVFVVDEKYDIDQISAINAGMKSFVSYIQGPPGTGKTQTILNAIVTAMFNDKMVLVTSNNNIPMDGVYQDILNLEYNHSQLLFPAIRLGNNDNINEALDRIEEMYQKARMLKPKTLVIQSIKKERKEALDGLVKLLANYEKIQDLNNIKHNLEINLNSITDEMLRVVTHAQLETIKKELDSLDEVDLNNFRALMKIDFRTFKMAIHYETAYRLQKLKKEKYQEILNIVKLPHTSSKERMERIKTFKKYLSEDQNLQNFQEIFPVIISTNLSCTYLGTPQKQFDIVMMDEAGQCSIANALIPIARGKQLMLVGDPQQLKPVIILDGNINQALMDKYQIPKEYNYIENSIYTTYTKVDVINNETLLSHHYRCNDKIIEFSNRKYYNNKLKFRGTSKEKHPLEFYDTSKDDINDNTYQKNISRVEAEFIVDYVKEHPNENIGIITPFVKQKECIETFLRDSHINNDNISVGTVHAYQGNQKQTIIFSTAITHRTHDKTYNWLKNNKELINVAVSRAVDKLIMLGNQDAMDKLAQEKDDLIELAKYIQSDGKSNVTNSSIGSQALGTRQISSESELDFQRTIKHALSVIDTNCYIKEEVPVSSIFIKDEVKSSLFYMQKFDVVIFQKRIGGDRIVLILELNGPEHLTRQQVIDRDNEKKRLCEKHKIEFKSIPRDCARDYFMIKDAIKQIIGVKK
mgnify:CR=1 FL=1